MRRPRLLPLAIAAAMLLVLVKAERIATTIWNVAADEATLTKAASARPPGPLAARAESNAAPAAATSAPPLAPAPAPPPEAAAERAVLEALRARRAEIEARESATASREVLLAAAERRLMQRVEELTALQTRLEALERERAAREDAGLRGLVRLYEGMRPRDAAQIFDDLDVPVLVSIVDRMKEAKAAPVLGAMRPERARLLTAELARTRAENAQRRDRP